MGRSVSYPTGSVVAFRLLDEGEDQDVDWAYECLGRVDKRLQPEASGCEVEEALEGQDGLVVAGGNTPLLFELSEHAFDAVAIPVAPIVGMFGHLAVRTGRDDWQDASDQQALAEAVAIVSLIGQQPFWRGDRDRHQRLGCGVI